MAEELFEEGWLEEVSLLGDEGLLAEDDGLCGGGVGEEEAPVDVAAVAEVRVVRLLG